MRFPILSELASGINTDSALSINTDSEVVWRPQSVPRLCRWQFSDDARRYAIILPLPQKSEEESKVASWFEAEWLSVQYSEDVESAFLLDQGVEKESEEEEEKSADSKKRKELHDQSSSVSKIKKTKMMF